MLDLLSLAGGRALMDTRIHEPGPGLQQRSPPDSKEAGVSSGQQEGDSHPSFLRESGKTSRRRGT